VGMETRDNVVVCVCIYILGGIIIVTILPITWIVTGLALLDV